MPVWVQIFAFLGSAAASKSKSFFPKKYLSAYYVTGNVLDTGDNNSGKRKTPALTEVIPYLRKT